MKEHLMEQEYQGDFFQEEGMEAAKKRRLLKGKPIKKRYFPLVLTYEHIAIFSIISIVIVSIFFLMGRWSSRSSAGTKEIIRDNSSSVDKVPAKTLEPLLVAPPQSPDRAGESISDRLKEAKALEKPDVAPSGVQEADPAPSSTEDTVKGWVLQVATFKVVSRADIEIAQLKKNGLKAFNLPSGEYHQVCIGPYSVKDKVLKLKERMRKEYADAYIRKIK